MSRPTDFGFFSNLIILTGITISAVVPLFFMEEYGAHDLPYAIERSKLFGVNTTPTAKAQPKTASNTGPEILLVSHVETSNAKEFDAVYDTIVTEQKARLQEATPNERARQRYAMPTPVGFEGQWLEVTLDEGKVSLHVLRNGFSLGQTQSRVGAEYFDYGSYVFDQMAEQVYDKSLAQQFTELSTLADEMAYRVRKASATQFDGAPNDSLEHLSVRSSILFHLNQLNQNAIHLVEVDQRGQWMTSQERYAAAEINQKEAGRVVARFKTKLQQIQNHPNSQEYGEALMVVKQQAQMLEALAMNMELRWESFFECPGGVACENPEATRMRLYTVQTTPHHYLQLATESNIHNWLLSQGS